MTSDWKNGFGAATDWLAGEDAFPESDTNLTGDRRTEARLCAVQALFQAVVGHADAATATKDFLADQVKRRNADKKIFLLIMDEAGSAQPRYMELLKAHLLENWTLERIDPVQVALLWAAAAELTAHVAVSPKVTINEFLNIAKGFAKPEEVAFVNAVLDRMVKQLRPDEAAPGRA